MHFAAQTGYGRRRVLHDRDEAGVLHGVTPEQLGCGKRTNG